MGLSIPMLESQFTEFRWGRISPYHMFCHYSQNSGKNHRFISADRLLKVRVEGIDVLNSFEFEWFFMDEHGICRLSAACDHNCPQTQSCGFFEPVIGVVYLPFSKVMVTIFSEWCVTNCIDYRLKLSTTTAEKGNTSLDRIRIYEGKNTTLSQEESILSRR